MDIATLAPVSVGIVRWASPRAWWTVVVNATYAIHGSREPKRTEPRALSLDRPSSLAPEELEAASDFVPQKEGVDLIVTGEACAEAPMEAIPASFALGDCERTFVAVAPAPATRVPLSAVYLRTNEGHYGRPVQVGPIARSAPGRRGLAAGVRLDARGLPLDPLDERFDFRFFNAAPAEQQLDRLPPGARLSLQGLLPGTPSQRVQVPRERPLVYLVAGDSETVIQRIGLRCDTVLVDTVRRELSLVFRGATDAAAGLERPCLVIGLEPPGERWDTREIRRRLRSAPPTRAVDPRDLALPAGAEDDEAAPADACVAGHARTEVTAPIPLSAVLGSALPFRPTPARRENGGAREVEERTQILDRGALGSRPVLPFVDGSAAGVDPRPPMPPGAEGAAWPGPHRARPSWEEVTETRPMGPERLMGTAALPFVTPGEDEPRPSTPPPAPIPLPVTTAPPDRAEGATPERAPGSPAESTGRPGDVAGGATRPARSNDELLPVAEFGQIRAALAKDGGAPDEVLERYGFDAASWRAQEKAQLAALEREMREGKSARAAALVKIMQTKARKPR